MNELDKPNFIGVGVMKSATTWLSECLRAHPEVFVSDVKELHFFSLNYEKGADWYFSNFKQVKGEKAIGEFSVSYVDSPEFIDRIKNDLGEVKILLNLRNPLDRFKSHVKHQYRVEDFDKSELKYYLKLEDFENLKERFPSLLTKGLYADSIEYLRLTFGEENVLVTFKEDIDLNPRMVLDEVYSFLQVDSNYTPPLMSKNVSQGGIPKSRMFETLRVKAYRFLKKLAPKIIVWVRRYRVAELYRNLNMGTKDITWNKKVDKLLHDYYLQDIERLEKLLNRDLSPWK